MNAYQKVVILLTGALLPLLLLFMNAMRYRGVWAAGLLGVTLAGLLVYSLRKTRAA
jgi:hypothetical protein